MTRYLLVTLLSLFCSSVAITRFCAAQEWVESGEKVFFVSKELMTWKEAATFCVRPEFNNRFRLAEVKNSVDNNRVTQALVQAGTGTEGGWFSAYLVNGAWKWGDLETVRYTAWEQREPNRTNRCAFMKLKTPSRGVWATAPCTEKKRAICYAHAYSRLFTLGERNVLLDRDAAEAACKRQGGSLAVVTSPSENKIVLDQAVGQDDTPLTRRPTRRPTQRPISPRPACCTAGDQAGSCCRRTFPRDESFCKGCRCCCCSGSNQLACCQRSNFNQCGCDNLPPTRFPTIRIPSRLLGEDSDEMDAMEDVGEEETDEADDDIEEPDEDEEDDTDDDGEEEVVEVSIPPRDLQQQTSNDILVFLGAKNVKVGFVKEENASFVWTNGVSFKPIGYLPKEISQIYTNWATYPLQNTNSMCIVLSSLDGKWYSAPCRTKLRGAVCEVRVTTKRYESFLEPSNQDDAGYYCSRYGVQLASIKTETELLAALREMRAKGLNASWTSGLHFGPDPSLLFWGDGFLISRDGVPIGLKKAVIDGPGNCVALRDDGFLMRLPCDAQLTPLCESRAKRSKPLRITPTPPDQCFPGCLQSMRGDGELDAVCNHYTCSFDHDDGGSCAPGCNFAKLSNGVCNPECFTASCAFDNRDCFDSTSGRRLQEAPLELPLACTQTSESCDPSWIGDKYCDVIACGRECDAQDCQEVEVVEPCPASCNLADLYNDRCDKGCATLGCNFDSGLCPVSCDAACGASITLNQCTRPACDVPMCRYDIGRCRTNTTDISQRCSPTCQTRLLGNGRCDAGCNNAACKWDAGDCPQRNFCPYPVPFDEYGCIDQCNKPVFKFQRGACPNDCLKNGCTLELLGNGRCDAACNNAKCGMDGGDCAPCAPGCNPFELNNGVCNQNCNLPGACGNDGGDCA